MLSPAAAVRRSVLALASALVLVVGCQSTAERHPVQRARTEKQAAAEIDRICALPAEQRETELTKIQRQSGVVLYCGQ